MITEQQLQIWIKAPSSSKIQFTYEQVGKALEKSEAASNLLGFFDLLLKVDRRANPQRYKLKKKIY